ncbi:MAG TPA: 50S ribosomal protein L24 [Verrucomicrobia bacterium]|nr:MAG: 50S ribosomal protein L24 [Lentisphaerae bacterium GWF2_57_35]HBA83561.1 50S ribosomal protein L24 [Verrucomicrobiota bacterium]
MKNPSKNVKLNVKKGDIVIAITGEDAASKKTGKVLQVFPEKGRAIVEGFNYVKKHMRKSQDNPQGGIVEKEAPIAVSNLKVQTQAEERGSKQKEEAKA